MLEKFEYSPIPSLTLNNLPDYTRDHSDNSLSIFLQTLLAPEGSIQQDPHVFGNPEKQFSIDQTDRRPIDRPSNVVAYYGRWFYQATHPTCTAWTIANAGLVLGIEPDKDIILHLSQMAKYENKTKRGLSNKMAVEYVNKQRAMSYTFLALDQKFSYESFQLLSTKTSFDELDGKNKARILPLVNLSPFSPDKDKSYENKILDTLDSGKPVITSVRSAEYSGGGKNHALCISGYRVDANGFTDFQVVDSARGIYWAPHERIMSARNKFTDYLAETKPVVE